jgi:DNA-directed RNA polymerase subunit omega
MIYPSIDKLLKEVGSKYLLVNIVSERVREIEKTKFYQMKDEEYVSKKNIGRVLEEIDHGLIHIKEVVEEKI